MTPEPTRPTLTPLSACLGMTPFDIEITVRLPPKRAFGIIRNTHETAPCEEIKEDIKLVRDVQGLAVCISERDLVRAIGMSGDGCAPGISSNKVGSSATLP